MTTSSIVDPEPNEDTGVNKYPFLDISEFLREGCSISTEMTFDSTSSDHSGTESNPHAGVELIVSEAEAAAAMEKGEIRDGQAPLQVLSPTCDSTLDDHFESEANVPIDEIELIVPEVEPTAVIKEIKVNTDGQESLHVQNLSVPQLAVLDATADPPRSSFCHSHGADLIISGPRTSSGHIPYSGSISMRSDSSTTSTHSFAFPVLQREWNTSPVKMAKARKQRWRFGLNCCKI